jgi:glycosyltransferase involved in cell wall biosynthesis
MSQYESPTTPPLQRGSESRYGDVVSQQAVFSTTILNWNRGYLLRKTLESYFETVSVPHEVFVVDNASSDDSRAIIAEFEARFPQLTAILLDENRGGEALNLGLERSKGRYLHLSENDLVYQPGWCETALAKFEAFPELGQLSVFGPVTTDEEPWNASPGKLTYRRGQIVYVTPGNVGTSSFLPREICDSGTRIHNYPSKTGTFLFPDDGRLSAEVKETGKWVAWCDRYLVRNLGHLGKEIEEHPEYYPENYASKDWFGLEGLRERMARWHAQPLPLRKSFLFGGVGPTVTAEKSSPTVECMQPQAWSMLDSKTPEVEAQEFLYGLVRFQKPRIVVETDAWLGHSAVAIGSALKQNGFGKLTAFEADRDPFAEASARIEDTNLGEYVEAFNHSVLEGAVPGPIDLLVLDGRPEDRAAEFKRLRSFLRLGSLVIFHDAGDGNPFVRRLVNRLVTLGVLSSLVVQSPRGFAVCQFRGRLVLRRVGRDALWRRGSRFLWRKVKRLLQR